MIDFVPTSDNRALGSHGAKHYRLTPLGDGLWRADRRLDGEAWVELAEPTNRTVAELVCDLDAGIPVPQAEPEEEAAPDDPRDVALDEIAAEIRLAYTPGESTLGEAVELVRAILARTGR